MMMLKCLYVICEMCETQYCQVLMLIRVLSNHKTSGFRAVRGCGACIAFLVIASFICGRIALCVMLWHSLGRGREFMLLLLRLGVVGPEDRGFRMPEFLGPFGLCTLSVVAAICVLAWLSNLTLITYASLGRWMRLPLHGFGIPMLGHLENIYHDNNVVFWGTIRPRLWQFGTAFWLAARGHQRWKLGMLCIQAAVAGTGLRSGICANSRPG